MSLPASAPPSESGPQAKFLFATCQVGAEAALKAEVARSWPDLRFAYSRPGFLTFKLPAGHALPDDFDLGAVFARAWGFSLGKATAHDLEQRVEEVRQIAAGVPIDALHVWPRDVVPAGDHRYEPGLTDASRKVAAALAEVVNLPGDGIGSSIARAGQRVLDCILVEPDEWWIGWHRTRSTNSCWPGGFFELALPSYAVSRAYLKMEEGLAWSGLPIRKGDCVVEIGCAPGGASQALLERNLLVMGVDPAGVDPSVLAHPNFKHFQKRGADMRRRELRDVRWLTADMNVAPAYTLTTVGEIVTHPEVKIAGMLLTLKLLEWHLADQLPSYVEQVRSWGYEYVAARQLAHNRQEICIAASRTPLAHS